MDTQLLMSILLGTIHHVDLIFRDCVVKGREKLPGKLIQLEMHG